MAIVLFIMSILGAIALPTFLRWYGHWCLYIAQSQIKNNISLTANLSALTGERHEISFRNNSNGLDICVYPESSVCSQPQHIGNVHILRATLPQNSHYWRGNCPPTGCIWTASFDDQGQHGGVAGSLYLTAPFTPEIFTVVFSGDFVSAHGCWDSVCSKHHINKAWSFQPKSHFSRY